MKSIRAMAYKTHTHTIISFSLSTLCAINRFVWSSPLFGNIFLNHITFKLVWDEFENCRAIRTECLPNFTNKLIVRVMRDALHYRDGTVFSIAIILSLSFHSIPFGIVEVFVIQKPKTDYSVECECVRLRLGVGVCVCLNVEKWQSNSHTQ